MDALILSCGTGGGHNAAARAVRDELLKRGHHVQMLDPYTLAGNGLDQIINQSYIKLVSHAPWAFGFLYFLGELYRRLPLRSPVYHLNGKMTDALLSLLEGQHFDIIVMPHIFPGEILTHMKHHGIPLPPTVLIATDYVCIPFTEEVDSDYCIIPAPDLRQEFSHYGIPGDRILPLGIPVGEQFSHPVSRMEARRRLGLDADRTYLLLSGGSMGAGCLVRSVKLLCRHFQNRPEVHLIVICGSNRRLYDRLTSQYADRITVLLYTDRMADYMQACDVVISKPGGLSSTEAATCNAPLIHISPIPGCESRNISYFSSHGMSLAVRSCQRQLIPAVEQLLDPAKADLLKQHQRTTLPPQSTSRICDLIESVAGAPSSQEGQG